MRINLIIREVSWKFAERKKYERGPSEAGGGSLKVIFNRKLGESVSSARIFENKDRLYTCLKSDRSGRLRRSWTGE